MSSCRALWELECFEICWCGVRKKFKSLTLSKKSDSSNSCWLSEFWLSLTKQDKVQMTVQGKAVVCNTIFMIFKVFDMYTESRTHNPADILSTFSLHVPSLLSSHLFSH